VVPIYDSSALSQTLGFRTMNTTSLHCTVCLFTSQLLLLSVYSARCVNDVLRLTLECRTCDLPIINPTRLSHITPSNRKINGSIFGQLHERHFNLSDTLDNFTSCILNIIFCAFYELNEEKRQLTTIQFIQNDVNSFKRQLKTFQVVIRHNVSSTLEMLRLCAI